MKYYFQNKQLDKNVLIEILQNRFAKFDDSIVKWRFRGKDINCSQMEKKIINIYANKKDYPKNLDNITYSDWIDIFDEGLKKLKSARRQPVLFFSGGKDSTFIASRMVQNNIKGLYYSFVTDNNEKHVINTLAGKLNI